MFFAGMPVSEITTASQRSSPPVGAQERASDWRCRFFLAFEHECQNRMAGRCRS